MKPPAAPFAPLDEAARARSLCAALAAADPGPVWVFAYGSLMWRPCFRPAALRAGWVRGYQRRFSMWTVSARGSLQAPGLGLALEAAPGRCEGLLLQVDDATREPDLARLWEREMLTGAFRPRWLEAGSAQGTVRALAFVIDPGHPQYAGALEPGDRVRLIATAAGELGSCHEYLASTVAALRAHGFRDEGLSELLAAVRALRLPEADRSPR